MKHLLFVFAAAAIWPPLYPAFGHDCLLDKELGKEICCEDSEWEKDKTKMSLAKDGDYSVFDCGEGQGKVCKKGFLNDGWTKCTSVDIYNIDIKKFIKYSESLSISKHKYSSDSRIVWAIEKCPETTVYNEQENACIDAGDYFSNNIEKVRQAYKARPGDINTKDNNETPLTYASWRGYLEIVKFLIEKGADLNARSNSNETPLTYASWRGYLEIVKFLIEKGADLNAKDSYDETALIYASRHGYLEIVKFLIEKGADLNAKNDDGRTALIYASRYGYLEIVKFLIEKGADLNAKDNYDETALDFAQERKYDEVVSFLKSKGAVSGKSETPAEPESDSGSSDSSEAVSDPTASAACNGKSAGDACTANGASGVCKDIDIKGGKKELRCVASSCPAGKYMVYSAAGNKQGWCRACSAVPGANTGSCAGANGRLACPEGFDALISKTGGSGDKCVAKTPAGAAQSEENKEESVSDIRSECEKNTAGHVMFEGKCITLAAKAKIEADRKAEQERNEKVRTLSAEITGHAGKIAGIKAAHSGDKASVWKNSEGKFNSARLASDSIAGVALGAVGGLVSAKVIKKTQIKKGFEALDCSSGGNVIAQWGDEFSISGPTGKTECEAAGGARGVILWASRDSVGKDYSMMREDMKNPENNACWIRVEIASTDVRIRTDSMKPRYFMVGSSGTCGSWLDEKSVEQAILAAKKGKRIGGIIAASAGGAALGVGAMELFGNKAIGGKVQGQKSLSGDELLQSQMTESERQEYNLATSELRRLCGQLSSIGGKSPDCQ